MAVRAVRRLPLHLEALRLLLATRVLLPTRGLTRTLAILARPRGRHAEPPDRLLRAVRRAGRAVPGSACLAQAVTLGALLARRGEVCEVVIGCQRGGGRWGAHAWVEAGPLHLDPVPGGDQTPLARCRAADGWRLLPAAGAAVPEAPFSPPR